MTRGHRHLALALTLALAAAACSNGDSAPTATGPVATSTTSVVSVVSTTTPATASTTTIPATSTTSISSTSTTVDATGFVGLSEDGPWTLVDSAPGVDTPGLIYELMPKLWLFLPTEQDFYSEVLYKPAPEDIPLIEAYARARTVFFHATSSNPMDLADPAWAEYFLDGGAAYHEALRSRMEQGQHADLDQGVVLRPRVLGEGRTDSGGIIFDCVLDGGVFLMPDGSLAPGSSRGVLPSGTSAGLVFEGDKWIVSTVSKQAEAC